MKFCAATAICFAFVGCALCAGDEPRDSGPTFSALVDTFNEKWTGDDAPFAPAEPLTVEELSRGLRQWVAKNKATWPTVARELESALESGRLSATSKLRCFRRFVTESGVVQHGVWIRLLLLPEPGEPQAVEIRSQVRFARPPTIVERMEAESVGLLVGRLITYFAKSPDFERSPERSLDYQALAKEVQTRLRAGEPEKLVRWMHFDGTDRKFQRFAVREANGLRDAKDVSVTVEPIGYVGTLRQWQAGSDYQPNAPMEARLRLRFPANGGQPPRPDLCYELGPVRGEPRILGYQKSPSTLVGKNIGRLRISGGLYHHGPGKIVRCDEIDAKPGSPFLEINHEFREIRLQR